jgi:hypothetical protein
MDNSTERKPPAPAPDWRPGWSQPQPEKLPEPTAWPCALALAVTLILWGLVSSLIITGIGLALFIAALAGWVADIRHERKS